MNRREKITKIRAKINKKQTQKLVKLRAVYFKINKIHKSLAGFIKKKEDSKIRKERKMLKLIPQEYKGS